MYIGPIEEYTFSNINENHTIHAEFGPITAHKKGDVNGDGTVSTLDLMTLARHLAKWEGYEAMNIDMQAADIDGDGTVTAKDRMLLARGLDGRSE